jgi:hypothetical protein
MEARTRGRLHKSGKLEIGARRGRVVLRFSDPVDEAILTTDEAFSLAKALWEKARDAGPIIMPGDLGAVPPVGGRA